MNRNKFLITLLSFAVAFGCVVALVRKQAAKTWRLPDGSEWSLAKVTYGKKHEMMYDNRWEDYLYPVLPASWRLKLGCRVATMATDPNGVVVWIWRKNVPQAQGPSAPHVIRAYYLAVVDKNGLESELEWEPSGRHLSPSGAELDLWRLRGRPAQGEITIRVYVPRWKNDRDGLRPQRVAEFKISNPKRNATPAWTSETLPATRKTNGLEVSLLELETGLNAKEVRMNWTGLEGKAFTRGRFNIRDRGQPSEAWDVTQITAIAASGEVRSPVSHYHQRHNDEYYYSLEGALWLEPWKLTVEISRNTNFPPEELWVVKNLLVPSAGKVNEFHAKTNIYGSELEFMGLSSPDSGEPQGWQGWPSVPGYYNLHAHVGRDLEDAHLKMVEMRDDQGRELQFTGTSARRLGSTPVAWIEHSWALDIPKDAKTLDVTFAFSKSVQVEFLAKPVMAGQAHEAK